MRRTVLVTGGAGYIGSHVAIALLDAGYDVLVVDNLSTGDKRLVPAGASFVCADVGVPARVAEILQEHKIDAVMHLAGSLIVPESVEKPLLYYGNNTAASLVLIEACVIHAVRDFVFSSTAAVYGEPERVPVSEDDRGTPINPYGASKLMVERILSDVANAHNVNYAALRYFNVAGADPAGRSGETSRTSTHLMKVAIETALGKRPAISIFGTDYPTPDGTCIRDYIHVSDVARAHVAAIEYLQKDRESGPFNCGLGRGYSVREVLRAVEEVAGRSLPISEVGRRLGDPAALVCDASKLMKLMAWRPQHTNLHRMIENALAWEERLDELLPWKVENHNI